MTLDDATNAIYSAFLVGGRGHRSTFRACLEVFEEEGLPMSLYTDRGSHYFTTLKVGEAVVKDRPTQVGRALCRLGIEHIAAYSPEARGRSERMFGVLQDRLIKELKQAGLVTSRRPTAGSRRSICPRTTRALPSQQSSPREPLCRSGTRSCWPRFCALRRSASSRRDYTVSWGRLKLQIPESRLRPHYVKARVRMHQ